MNQKCPNCHKVIPDGMRFCGACGHDMSFAIPADGILQPGTTLRGSYVIEHMVGEGGMGVVYACRHKTLDKVYAIKVLEPKYARMTSLRARFLSEGKIQAKLTHPHIVKVIDVIDNEKDGGGGFLAIVMEYVKGDSLDQIIKRGPLSEFDAVSTALVMLDAIGYAHHSGIVHRDLKPSNVMICNDLAKDALYKGVKVMDFGIAKLLESDTQSLTMTGSTIGTPLYMPPEQIERPREIDERADLYAIGITLYELLCGRTPFAEYREFDLFRAQLSMKPPSMKNFRRDISDRLEAIIMKALEKNRENRYPNAEAFQRALLSLGGYEEIPLLLNPYDGMNIQPTNSILQNKINKIITKTKENEENNENSVEKAAKAEQAKKVANAVKEAVVSKGNNPITGIVSEDAIVETQIGSSELSKTEGARPKRKSTRSVAKSLEQLEAAAESDKRKSTRSAVKSLEQLEAAAESDKRKSTRSAVKSLEQLEAAAESDKPKNSRDSSDPKSRVRVAEVSTPPSKKANQSRGSETSEVNSIVEDDAAESKVEAPKRRRKSSQTQAEDTESRQVAQPVSANETAVRKAKRQLEAAATEVGEPVRKNRKSAKVKQEQEESAIEPHVQQHPSQTMTINDMSSATEMRKKGAKTAVAFVALILLIAACVGLVYRNDANMPQAVAPAPVQEEVVEEVKIVDDVSQLPLEVKNTPYGRMSLIPAGKHRVSTGKRDEKGHVVLKNVELPAFYIDQTEVSQYEYMKCVEAEKCPPLKAENASGTDPVTGVNFKTALEFCEFAGKTLPTAQQWEAAARYGNSDDGISYVNVACDTVNYGSTSDCKKVNPNRPASVFSHANSGNPAHLRNMLGNVREWVNTPDSGNKNMQTKGGSYLSKKSDIAISAFVHQPNNQDAPDLGFRCISEK